jgi:hypothetical protein
MKKIPISKVKRKRPSSTIVALYVLIMPPRTFIIIIRSPSVSDKLSRQSIILKKKKVTMVYVLSATMPTMLILAPATSGLISNFRSKTYPFPALALIIIMALLRAPSRRQPNGPGPCSCRLSLIGHKLLIRPMFSNSGILQWTIQFTCGITYLKKRLIALPFSISLPLLIQTTTTSNGIMFGAAPYMFCNLNYRMQRKFSNGCLELAPSCTSEFLLSTTTCLISPLFHVIHDDLFDTIASYWDDGTFDP